jgi:rhodanese-related sulfurtransferase
MAVNSKATARTRIPSPSKARRYFEDKMAFTTGPVELNRMINNGDPVLVVDLRAAEDYAEGHIPGAINLPKPRWDTFDGLRKDRVNILYCYSQVCHLAAAAGIRFAGKGFPVMELEGGFGSWSDHGLEIAK